MSRPLKVQIVERARELIADEQHWCRRHLALDKNGVVVSPTSGLAVKRCDSRSTPWSVSKPEYGKEARTLAEALKGELTLTSSGWKAGL
jgi:hypothetical protein